MTQTDDRPGTREKLAVEVRKSAHADEPAVCAALARAFDDDPMVNWMAAQDARRERRVLDAMALTLEMTKAHDEVYTTTQIHGGALWAPPGKWKLGALQQLMLVPRLTSVTTWKRIWPIMMGINALERKHPTRPHFYLFMLGVDTEFQGRGVGTELMRPVLERCDREGIPAYLESSKERNVPLYERNGFKVTEEFVVPSGGPKMWLMWREPLVRT